MQSSIPGGDLSNLIAAVDVDAPTATQLTRAMWEAIGGDAGAMGRLRLTGSGDMSSPFPVMDMAAASFATAGLAVSTLLEGVVDRVPGVSVDRRQATTWSDFPVAPSRFLDVADSHGMAGHLSSIRGSGHTAWMTEFPTADERWVRVQATLPTLRARMLKALGLPASASPEDVAPAIAALAAEELEERFVAAGAVAAVARSVAEWDQHPQGLAVAQEPIADITETSVGPRGWTPTPERPLLGIRVLDMTRVVAGPMATRFLAMLGAEVLRIDRPGSDEVGMLGVHDIVLGKRWALLDGKSDAGRKQLHELVAGADVLVHGYRPGVLDSLGLDPDTRDRLSPGLVDVALNAYGWTGPWRDRRGFDTLVQFSTGIAHEVSRWANIEPENRLPLNAIGHLVDASRPRHLPVESLDFGTGYQLAAAAIMGLAKRLQTGRGSRTRMSLARTARLLVDHAAEPADPSFRLPDRGAALEDRVHAMGNRPTRRLVPPVGIEGVPLFCDRPAELPGSSTPAWATDDREDRAS